MLGLGVRKLAPLGLTGDVLIQGPLRFDGKKGSWTHGASPAFLAMARVPPQHQQQLAPLLRVIAVERGAGSFELSSNKTAFGP